MRQFRRLFSSIQPRPDAPLPTGPPPVPPISTARQTGRGRHIPNFQFTLAQAGLVVACGAAVLGMVRLNEYAMERRRGANERAVVSEEVVGKPKLGGPWTLIDCRTGQPVTSEDLKGKFQLVYFGFTYCPDICPEELEKQRTVLDRVEKETGVQVVPIFITVDPRRDTCAQTEMYINEFHPRTVGLTGTPEMIKRVTRLFRVYYNEGIKITDGEDYLVDHSIIHYLIGRRNEFIDFYGKNLNVDEMTGRIKAEIQKDEKRRENKKLKNGISEA
jgi:cytochrome oxidase Cu insertion factor (SCO1/SenC/PrrC family)